MRGAALALLLAVACHPSGPVERIATPAPGITMALYQSAGKSYTVVDDRRFVELRGGQLLLDHIDPGAALPSLVIEPLGSTDLAVGQCDRDHETHPLPPETALERYGEWQARRAQRLEDGDLSASDEAAPDSTITVVSPVVRCAATGGAGKQLVRILYVTTALGYRGQHDVKVTTSDRAVIATRFAIATPAWSDRADVVLYAGIPGGDRPAVELARGSLTLDGSTSVIGAAPREVPARVRRVFDGAIRNGVGDANDPAWGRDSVHAVWLWLELEGATLPAGPTHAYLELPGEPVREIEVPSAGREDTATGTRLPLWIDDQLRGIRDRKVYGADGASLEDRLAISVSNLGTEPREVWIEEKLRPAKRRTLVGGWPNKPILGADVARTKVTIKPGGTERAVFVIAYVF